MSFLDDIKSKAEELMGSVPEEMSNHVEDATSGLTDLSEQAQDILPGNNQEEK